MIHICPETNGIGKIFPHSFVFPYRFFTFFDKRLYSIFFNLLFSIQTEKLFYFQFHRKSMSIPSGFSRYAVSFHCTVSWNHIFDDTCQNVANVWFTIGCRWSVIKHIRRASLTQFYTLLKNIMIFPKFFYFFFAVNKV